MEERLNRCSGGLALVDGSGQAYNEEAFHYFLELERKRSEISGRLSLLMLIGVKKRPGISPQRDVVRARKLLSILSQCLRETDFVGWYREGLVAGAVLTQHGDCRRDDLYEAVRRRIGLELQKRLPSGFIPHLEVRVCRLSPRHFRSE